MLYYVLRLILCGKQGARKPQRLVLGAWDQVQWREWKNFRNKSSLMQVMLKQSLDFHLSVHT